MAWIGYKINDRLIEKNISREELAFELSDKNVDVELINKWIDGLIPRMYQLIRLCELLKIDVEDLFSIEPDKFTISGIKEPEFEFARNIVKEHEFLFKNEFKNKE